MLPENGNFFLREWAEGEAGVGTRQCDEQGVDPFNANEQDSLIKQIFDCTGGFIPVRWRLMRGGFKGRATSEVRDQYKIFFYLGWFFKIYP